MSEKSASSLDRMLSILDLFNEQTLYKTPEEIALELDVSLPTSYRYIKMLAKAGLLQRTDSSCYTLGPRVIVLDHYIRQADPVLRTGIPVMAELVATTGLDCVMSGLFGTQVLDTHHEMGEFPTKLVYTRGRIRPLFKGAAPKIILAQFSTLQLRKLFDAQHQELTQCGLPNEWHEFKKHYATIRKQGYYISFGELEPEIAAIAAPIIKADGSVCGAVSVVTTVLHMNILDTPKLAQIITSAARQISERLT